DIVDNLQKQKLLNTFNDANKSYDNTKTLEKYFEEQVEKNPEKTAVIFNQDKLSYGELNKRANEIAWELKERGVTPGDKVAILLNRGLEVYASIFAVLKAGAIYVPINDEYPNSRIDYMLEDSNAKVIITEESLKSRICRDINILLVNDEGLKNNPGSNLDIANTLNSVCYIIYTSGSTGQSKGTLVMHKNVIRVVKDNNYININENDILLQISNHAFDGSVFDIFGALLNGSTLVGVDKGTILSVDKLSNVIATKGITIAFMTTALFNVIVDSNLEALKGMRKILFGGERVSVEHVRKAFNTLGRDKLMHVYGPTETAVFATYYNIDTISENQVTVPIGKALTNTKLYVLDESLRLKPIGVQGQLYIGGDAVSLGYLNREDLNREKFIKNPFNQEEIIYATGDLVRYLPSGDIEFLDRIDNQVKIRGFRIELGEIEKEILSNDKIKEAVVVAIEDENKNTVGLCAYYVCSGDVKKEDIKLSLMEKLPQYMIPSYYVEIEKMPLNANKKIDKKSLPAPDENSVIKNEYIEPTTEIEKKIAEVWKEVLSYENISITDNFFELGG
ncbi:MAG: non-ribosomal peptide synthetase, partial [Clostridium sp.]